jgi:hypothetical protein
MSQEMPSAVYYEALAAGEVPLVSFPTTPKTQKQVRSGVLAPAWIESETKEWEGLWEKGAFEDVSISSISPEQRLLHLLWVYRVKNDGTLKSRICADGRR